MFISIVLKNYTHKKESNFLQTLPLFLFSKPLKTKNKTTSLQKKNNKKKAFFYKYPPIY